MSGWGPDQERADLETIALHLDRLKRQADASGMPMLAYLIDVAVAETHHELAQQADVEEGGHSE